MYGSPLSIKPYDIVNSTLEDITTASSHIVIIETLPLVG